MKKLLVATLALVVVVGAAGWWFFLRDDAPEEAALSSRDTSAPATAPAAGFDGTWAVQPGEAEGATLLSDEAPGSWVGYRVDEELRGINVTAVGRTNGVTGQLTYAGGSVTDASFEADLTTLRSDAGQRDNALETRGIETEQFPTATFAITQPIAVELGDEPFQTDATGDLTLHGVTQEVTMSLEGQLLDSGIEVVGSTDIAMADYDIEPISLGFVTTSDTGVVELKLLLVKQ